MRLIRAALVLPVALSLVNGFGLTPLDSPAVAHAASSSGATLPQTGRMLQRFAPTYMSKTGSGAYSTADATLIAQNYDLVVGNSKQFANMNLPAMKSANPNVRVLVYMNGSFDMKSGCCATPPTTYQPSTLYAKDANGKDIYSTKYKNWLMDIGDSGWATTVSQICDGLLKQAAYDGCFVDMLGDALLGNNYLSGAPINPATGKVWTASERMAATTKIGQTVTANHPNNIIMGNGLNDGQRYFDSAAPTAQLLNGLNVALAETWLRQATRTIGTYRSPSAWQQEVDMLADVGSRGKAAGVTTKVWITATAAQITSWHRYALASFLLGTSGSSYFTFTSSQGASEFQTYATDPLDRTDVGAASGLYQMQGPSSNQVFLRQYAKADVIVNPNTGSATATVSAPCTTLDGVNVTQSFTIAAHTGEICTYGSGGSGAPVVSQVKPNNGSPAGGTQVTVTGTGFTSGSTVKFGSNAATAVTVNPPTQITATSPAGTGTVDVTVTTSTGTSAASNADQFTYVAPAAPMVTSVTPSSGPEAGNTIVTIIGTGFGASGSTGATVKFGTAVGTAVTVNSPTQITATSSAGAGTVDVTVTTSAGTSATSSADQFIYVAPAAPTVTNVQPSSGLEAGGTVVTISGTGFGASGSTGATVTFGTAAGTAVTVNSPTQIMATSPAGTGTVDVIVTTSAGTSATSSADQYTYAPAPSVSGVHPATGAASGGTVVTISGTGFITGATVNFGSAAGTQAQVISSSQITVTSPPGTVGSFVDVTVTTPGGTSTANANDKFTYV